jgi:hypothetical protein
MRLAARTTMLFLVCSACGGRTQTLTASSGGPSGTASAASGSSVGSGATASASGAAASSDGSGASSGSTTGASAGSASGSAAGTSEAGCDDGACGPVPASHRPDDSECQMAAPVGTCHATSSNTAALCYTDSQCTTGTNGRCQQLATLTYDYCACTYDTCVTDSDCGPGETCACHGAPDSYGAGNTCVPGNCRVDNDCGPGGYCSPSYGGESIQNCPVGGRGLQGYYCHTANDTCLNQSDCPNPFGESCAYSAVAGFWQCTLVPGGDGCSERDQ